MVAQATPLLAVLILLAVSPRRRHILHRLGVHRRGGWRWYGWAFLLPVPPIAISYVVAAAIGLVQPPSEAGYSTGSPLIRLTLGYVLMTALPLLWAFGEEIGWRGFLQGRLVERLGIAPGVAVTGLVWAVWHYPFIVWGDYFRLRFEHGERCAVHGRADPDEHGFRLADDQQRHTGDAGGVAVPGCGDSGRISDVPSNGAPPEHEEKSQLSLPGSVAMSGWRSEMLGCETATRVSEVASV